MGDTHEMNHWSASAITCPHTQPIVYTHN
uniref:Uncharacterized protein n=1 Tax=Anguilla anguilla TaxID=7936 RepID=A0A0E9R6F9_ANGAN